MPNNTLDITTNRGLPGGVVSTSTSHEGGDIVLVGLVITRIFHITLAGKHGLHKLSYVRYSIPKTMHGVEVKQSATV